MKISKKLPEKWKRLQAKQHYGRNIKRVKGGLGELYRLRIGGYRVVYGVKDDPREISLLRVGHRRSVYEGLPIEPNPPDGVVVTDDASATHQPSEATPKDNPRHRPHHLALPGFATRRLPQPS